MSTPRKRVSKKPKRKGKIVVKQKAQLRKKSAHEPDTIPQMAAQMPRNAAPVFKVKIRHKQ